MDTGPLSNVVKVPLRCAKCNQEFYGKSHLNDHLYGHIKGKALIKEICSRGLSDISELNDYFNRQHVQVNIFSCEVCDEEFSEMSHFNKHMSSKSTDILFCDICNTNFPGSSQMIKHLLIHTKEKSFQCKVCKKTFYRKGYLIQHLRTHNKKNKGYICRICKTGFPMKYSLKIHLLTAHEELAEL